MDNNYTLSDLRAVTDGGYGCGGGGFLLLLVLFMLFGGGYNRSGEFNQFATAASQNEVLLGQKFDALSRQVGAVGDGLCSSTYALNNTITGEGRGIQMQIANAECGNQKNVDALRYDMANMNAATNAAVTAQTQKILDAMAQNKIDTLQAQVNELKTQNMFCGIPRINPYGYGVYAYPQAQGCGCGFAGA